MRRKFHRNFLRKEYVENQRSISQIAAKTGADWATVKRALISTNVNLRTHKEQAAISSPGGQFKHTNFLTKQFFIENYVTTKISLGDLAKNTGINEAVLRRYMRKSSIRIRTRHEQRLIKHPKKEFNLTEETLAFLDGLLLGDGSIPKGKYGANSYTQACKYKQYLEFIKARLEQYGITSSPVATFWVKDPRCKRGGYVQNYLQTHRFKTFETLRNRWYKDREKIIPRDFRFTPESLLHFYLCDGNHYREIRLCTTGFDPKYVKFLRSLLIKHLDIKSRLITSPSLKGGADLAIKKSDKTKFLSYIGKCPVKCYEYKWTDPALTRRKDGKVLMNET